MQGVAHGPGLLDGPLGPGDDGGIKAEQQPRQRRR